MDKYRMNSHKLYWHLDEVNDWLSGKRVVPLHMDIGITKGCDIACVYCYGVTQGRKGKDASFIPREPLINFMKNASEVGVKSIAITGEGEPTLNPHLTEALIEGKKVGLDIGLATWGGRLNENELEDLASSLVWIRFNIRGADKISYKNIHRTSEDNFEKVIKNVEKIISIKDFRNLPITVGLQMVTMPYYAEEAVKLAKLGKKLGVDYLEIKHCSDTFDGKLKVKFDEYDKISEILKEAESIGNEKYNVIIKWEKINKKKRRGYNICYCAGNFMLRMSGNGTVFPCAQFYSSGSEEFAMGSIVEKSFKDIIYSTRYEEILKKVLQLNVHKECYSGCKEDAINEFLWMLKHPPEHVNFI